MADSEVYRPQIYNVIPDKDITIKNPCLTPSLLKKRDIKKTTLSNANADTPKNMKLDFDSQPPEITSGPEYIYAVGLSNQRLQYDERYH